MFNLASKNLNNQSEKHFEEVFLVPSDKHIKEESTLNDDSFADITFDLFRGMEINKISNKAFGKLQNEAIKEFWCVECYIENQLPNYDIWSTLSQFKNLNNLHLGLNATEIPSNAFNRQINVQIDSKKSMLETLSIEAKQKSFVIKSGAFHNLTKLLTLELKGLSSLKFEKQVFNHRTAQNASFLGFNHLSIIFSNSSLTGDSFESGLFDYLQPELMSINFYDTKIDYLPESTFKSLLNKTNYNINFGSKIQLSTIDCSDCRNKWLINVERQEQLNFVNSSCLNEHNRNLFDQEIKDKLKSKCK